MDITINIVYDMIVNYLLVTRFFFRQVDKVVFEIL